MGEDIHERIYVKHRATGKYVNAHEFCDWCPCEGSLFEELVKGRDYSVFSLFGSNRGEYSPLKYANYGMPDFLRGTAFDEYCMSMGYYGFTWFRLPEFSKSVKEYAEILKDPSKYLDEDSDAYSDWTELMSQVKAGKEGGYEKFIGSYGEWLNYHKHVLDVLSNMDEILGRFSAVKDNYKFFGDMLDMDETVFLFFFDN